MRAAKFSKVFVKAANSLTIFSRSLAAILLGGGVLKLGSLDLTVIQDEEITRRPMLASLCIPTGKWAILFLDLDRVLSRSTSEVAPFV